MEPMNLVYIMSDQHNPRMMGCAGHPTVRTPHMDALAARGVRFTTAYTNCPICVPARASFATGRYIHEIGYWDNGIPYDGRERGWGHRLIDQGHHVTTIGKLHYRNERDDTGMDEQRIPMHVKDGKGDVFSMLREPPLRVPGSLKRVLNAGPGESSYSRYDRAIATESVRWLRQDAGRHEKPWVLFTSLVCPHPPWKAPAEFYDMYPLDAVELPVNWRERDWPRHPAIDTLRWRNEIEGDLDEETVRRAIATYYALCSYLDHNVGQVLAAIDEAGLADRTRVVYTSDHGETLGEHGLWGKCCMYESSVGIPFMLAGPDVPAGRVVGAPISLVDSYQTILEAVGCPPDPAESPRPGTSLWPIARGEAAPERAVFSEYHAAGSLSGISMVRVGRYKFVYYVGLPAQLFDREADPYETTNLADDPRYADVRRECEAALRRIVDPEEVDRRAKAAQATIVEANGGVEAVKAAGPPFTEGTPAPAVFGATDSSR